MTTTESRLRDAFTAAAVTVRQESLRQLTEPEAAPARVRRWTAPLAVAAATALAVAGVAVAPWVTPQRHRTQAVSSAPTPPYALTVDENGRANVLNAVSGQVVETLAPQTRRYIAVAGHGDTFFLAVRVRSCVTAIYRVAAARDGLMGEPVPLAGRPVPIDVDDMAMAPDGRHLAVSGGCGGTSDLTVIDLRTLLHLNWSDDSTPGGLHFAWAADSRTIGFFWWSGSRQGWLGLLNTTVAGATLFKSRLLRGETTTPDHPVEDHRIHSFVFNPNGRTLTASIQASAETNDAAVLEEVSGANGATTGHIVARLPKAPYVIAADRSGQHFVVLIDGRMGRVDQGHFSWVGTTAGLRDIAW